MNSLINAAGGYLAAMSALIWIAIFLMPWRPWRTREVLDGTDGASDEDLSDLTVVIPARNEAAVINRTLRALANQGRGLRIIVVDDQSIDGTTRAARDTIGVKLEIVAGTKLPAGWSGKLWALEQGRARIATPLMLLLDADIELRPGILAAAKGKLLSDDLELVSLLAVPRMQGFWEKLLMPAFVYFFKLLYPFRCCTSPRSRVAAAAGGFVLLKTRVLDEIGGFTAIRGELIDDCALARRVKNHTGGRIWLGLSHSVHSLRSNRRLMDIWNMITRTAFTQLKYSKAWLALCTLVMALAFWMPVLTLFHDGAAVRFTALASLAIMMLTYLPTLRFYGRSPSGALAMPLIGTLYLAMTWGSAIQYWQGQHARWKGRIYRGERA